MPSLRLICSLLLPLLFAIAAHATGTSGDVIPGYTGILVTAGGVLPRLPVQGDYIVNNFSPTKSLSGTYRLGFKLITVADVAVSDEVFSAQFTVSLLPRSAAQGAASVVLLPSSLRAGDPYLVSSRLYLAGATPGTWSPVGFAGTSDEYRFTLVDTGSDSGLVGQFNGLAVDQAYAVDTAPASAAFKISVQGVLGRRDQPTQPVVAEDDRVFFDVTITGDRTGPVLLRAPRTTVPVVLVNHAAGGAAVGVLLNQELSVRPAAQMDSTDSYTLTVSMSHAGPDGVETMDRTVLIAGQRFLHFNGALRFGPVAVTVTAINNDPDARGTVAGVGENSVLGIGDHGAFLNGNPQYEISSGQTLKVLLGIDGMATAIDPASVDVPPGAVSTVAGVSFVPDRIKLDSGGAHATRGTVRFPAGFGVAEAPNLRRLRSEYPVGSVNLDAALHPVGVVALSPTMFDAQHLYAVHEDLPEQFEASSISWGTATGTFTVHRTGTRHVRADETAALDALALTPETLVAKLRPSNDGYLANPGPGVGVDVVVAADAQGRAVLADATVDLPPSQFTPHFPAAVVVAWTQSGQLSVKAGAIAPGSSALPGASDVQFPTLPGAPSLGLMGGPESFAFSPTNGVWNVTADGGLHAVGAVSSGTVRWGARNATDFAQTAGMFADGAALIPGTALRGALAGAPFDMRPGELLLSGHGKPGDETYAERPFTAGYASGSADYAGLNLRASTTRAQRATSLVGDATLGPYPLLGVSKYYVRNAGVSGMHVGDPSFFSGSGGKLAMYGFALTLTDFQLAYRDNSVVDSLVAGMVEVPGVRGKPGFSQPFSKLFLDPQGQPGNMVLPQNAALEQPLVYWHSQFHPLSAEFVSANSVPKKVALVFGAEVSLPGILAEPVRGGLGFLPNGSLASAQFGIPGVNSRMKPPKKIVLHGPGSKANPAVPGFTVNPVGDFYFNDPYFPNPNAPTAPEDGFVAFAGTIDVPFFEDLKVHVLARADTGRTAVRTWPAGPDKKDFFSDRNFDSANLGFPAAAGYAAYINEDEPAGFTYFDENDPAHKNRNPYNPIARKSWLSFVDFALPLRWDPARRRFVSSVPEQRPFLVMTSERAIQQLTPSGAEIRFGLQFNKLPRLNLASMVIDQREVTRELTQIIPDGGKLAAAAGAFEQLLGGQTDQLVTDGVDAVIDGLIDGLLGSAGALATKSSAAQAAAGIGLPGSPAFEALRLDLRNRLSGVIGAANMADSVAGQLADALDSVDQGLTVADTLLAKDAKGQRGDFITDSVKLASSLGLPAEDIKPVTDSITSEINGPLAPTLDAISSQLDEVHDLSKSARGLVNDARSVTQGALAAVNVADQLPTQILNGIRGYFEQAHDPAGTLLDELGPGRLRTELKKVAHDVVNESDFVAQLQQTVRDLAEPLRDEFGVVNEQIFGAMNDIVRSAMEELSNQVVDHLNDTVGQANRAYGGFSKTLELTKVEGTAQILGDSVDNAHLNATLGLYVPDKVSLSGAVDFKRVHGSQPVPPCVGGAADGRIQITVTARGDASLGGSKAGHAEVHGQYTMDAKGEPLALSGGMSLDADVNVDIVTLKTADFEFVFGAGDNYVRGEGAGSILAFDVNTRAFFGRTCDAKLIQWVDPRIKDLFSVLGRPAVDSSHPLVGYYMMADGDVILNRILDIPDSVVLLKASGGQGNFIFTDPSFASIVPGMHWRLGLTVGLGPVSAGAELVALGGLDPIKLSLDANGLPQVLQSFLLDPLHTVHGAVSGRFTPKFEAGPVSWGKDFDFTAQGNYSPVPPPGLFLVKQLKF